MRGHRTPLSTIGLSQFQKFHSQQAPCKSAECLRSCYLRKIFRCAGKKFISIFVGPDTRFVSNKLDHDAQFTNFAGGGYLFKLGSFGNIWELICVRINWRRYGKIKGVMVRW